MYESEVLEQFGELVRSTKTLKEGKELVFSYLSFFSDTAVPVLTKRSGSSKSAVLCCNQFEQLLLGELCVEAQVWQELKPKPPSHCYR